jgi:predicted solute-binding protein
MSFGVVSYLNMLPYFADTSNSSGLLTFPTPSALNVALQNHSIDAGCVSNIVGLRNGFSLCRSRLGIASRGAVQSVYLEPIWRNSGDDSFWNNLQLKNQGGLARLRNSNLIQASNQVVTIVTSGASEQSLWLFRSLMRAQGVDSKVLVLESADQLPHEQLLNFAEPMGMDTMCLLSIGDDALRRRFTFPSQLRLDLGEFWTQFSELDTCVFAAWYVSSEKSLANNSIWNPENALAAWERAEESVRKKWIEKFWIAKKNTQTISQTKNQNETLQNLVSYLNGIVFRFDNTASRCLEAYGEIYKKIGELSLPHKFG